MHLSESLPLALDPGSIVSLVGHPEEPAGQGLGLVLLVAVWLLGTRPVAENLLWPLERQYQVPGIASLQKSGVRQVVVLTGGGFAGRDEMLHSAFPHASVYRFLGGVELASQLGPECRVIFSGSAGRGRGLATASTMEDLSRLISPGRPTAAEIKSDSTAEHPGNVKALLRDEPFALVTSALHMPRSMRNFHRSGMNPIPYPVDFLVQGNYGSMDWIPSMENWWKLNAGLREYVATLFYLMGEYRGVQKTKAIFSRRDAEAQSLIDNQIGAMLVWTDNPLRPSGSAGKNPGTMI